MDWPLLAALPPATRESVLRTARRRRFDRDEVVCHAGDPADSVHFVRAGHLAVRVMLPTGDTVVLNVIGPGDQFGEIALLRRDGRRTATVVALEGAETLVLDAATFRRLVADHDPMGAALGRLLADRIDALSQRLLEGLYLTLDRRVARCLHGLASTYESASGAISIPLAQQQIANLVGGSRASVNPVLRQLEAEGVIALGRGRIDVLDVPALEDRAGL